MIVIIGNIDSDNFLILDDAKRLDPDWARNKSKNTWYVNYNKSINFRTSNGAYKLTHEQNQWLLNNKDTENFIYTCLESQDVEKNAALKKIDKLGWVKYSGCKLVYTRGLSKTKSFVINDFEYSYDDFVALDSKLGKEISIFHKQEARNKLLSELF